MFNLNPINVIIISGNDCSYESSNYESYGEGVGFSFDCSGGRYGTLISYDIFYLKFLSRLLSSLSYMILFC